jgi:hypothetical protein
MTLEKSLPDGVQHLSRPHFVFGVRFLLPLFMRSCENPCQKLFTMPFASSSNPSFLQITQSGNIKTISLASFASISYWELIIYIRLGRFSASAYLMA